MRPPVLHLRDLRVRIERVLPVLVRRALLPAPVQARQGLAGRRLDPRGRGETRQELLVALAGVPPHDAPHRRVGLQRRRVDGHGPPREQAGGDQALQHPGEHGPMGLHGDQPPRARDRGMIGGRGVEAEPHEAAHGERIGRPPGDATLRVEPFEVSDQQQPEVQARRQARPAHHRRVELPTRRPPRTGRSRPRRGWRSAARHRHCSHHVAMVERSACGAVATVESATISPACDGPAPRPKRAGGRSSPADRQRAEILRVDEPRSAEPMRRTRGGGRVGRIEVRRRRCATASPPVAGPRRRAAQQGTRPQELHTSGRPWLSHRSLSATSEASVLKGRMSRRAPSGSQRLQPSRRQTTS